MEFDTENHSNKRLYGVGVLSKWLCCKNCDVMHVQRQVTESFVRRMYVLRKKTIVNAYTFWHINLTTDRNRLNSTRTHLVVLCCGVVVVWCVLCCGVVVLVFDVLCCSFGLWCLVLGCIVLRCCVLQCDVLWCCSVVCCVVVVFLYWQHNGIYEIHIQQDKMLVFC